MNIWIDSHRPDSVIDGEVSNGVGQIFMASALHLNSWTAIGTMRLAPTQPLAPVVFNPPRERRKRVIGQKAVGPRAVC